MHNFSQKNQSFGSVVAETLLETYNFAIVWTLGNDRG